MIAVWHHHNTLNSNTTFENSHKSMINGTLIYQKYYVTVAIWPPPPLSLSPEKKLLHNAWMASKETPTSKIMIWLFYHHFNYIYELLMKIYETIDKVVEPLLLSYFRFLTLFCFLFLSFLINRDSWSSE